MKFFCFLLFYLFTLPPVNIQEQEIAELSFLTGTWKINNKENYEYWKVDEKGHLKGESYKIKNGNKVIREYLKIRKEKNQIIYSARVLNQNNGQAIDFKLNQNSTPEFSFENLEHDFPKKIVYSKINDTLIHVKVLGKDDKGFKLQMVKQK